MKKLFVLSILSLVVLGGAFAADPDLNTTYTPPAAPTSKEGSVVVNAYLAGYLTLSNMTTKHEFTLDTAGATEAVANARIATNLKYWKLTLESLNADATSAALVNADSNRIPYTVTLTGGDTIGTLWSGSTLTAAKLSKNFATRVTGGAAGELVTLSITYGGEDTATWFANMQYTDTLKITVAAN